MSSNVVEKFYSVMRYDFIPLFMGHLINVCLRVIFKLLRLLVIFRVTLKYDFNYSKLLGFSAKTVID